MIYVMSTKHFMYHKDHYDKRGRQFTIYYEILEGQLLTVCEAIQKFEMTIDEILNEYETYIVQLNRRHTVKDDDNHRFVEEGYNGMIIVY